MRREGGREGGREGRKGEARKWEREREGVDNPSDRVAEIFVLLQVRCMAAILFLIGHGLERSEVIDHMLDIERCPCKPQYGMASGEEGRRGGGRRGRRGGGGGEEGEEGGEGGGEERRVRRGRRGG